MINMDSLCISCVVLWTKEFLIMSTFLGSHFVRRALHYYLYYVVYAPIRSSYFTIHHN